MSTSPWKARTKSTATKSSKTSSSIPIKPPNPRYYALRPGTTLLSNKSAGTSSAFAHTEIAP